MAAHVESPCVRNCCLNDADICVGCFRSLEEITRWSLVNDATKQYILEQATERRSQAHRNLSNGRDTYS